MLWGAMQVARSAIALYLFYWGADDRALCALLNKTEVQSVSDPDLLAMLIQHCFNLFIAGIAVFGVAFLNWRNYRSGYWINLFLGGIINVGLLLKLSMPGHIDITAVPPSNFLLLAGALLTTIGTVKAYNARRSLMRGQI